MKNQNDPPVEKGLLSRTWFEQFNFLIVDAEQLQLFPGELPFELLLPRGFEANEGLMPSLLDINQLDLAAKTSLFELIDHTSQSQEAAPISALIAANCTQQILKMHLRQSQSLIHNGQKAWLRIFDSRVWSQLPRVMGAARMNQFFGPIQCWSTALYGEWMDTYPMDIQHTSTTHSLNWQSLVRVGSVNRTLARLARLSWADAGNLGEAIDRLIDHAEREYRLSRTEDAVSFAYYGIKYGLNFDAHPAIQLRISEHMRLADENDEDSTIVDILNMIDENEWQTIQRELKVSK